MTSKESTTMGAFGDKHQNSNINDIVNKSLKEQIQYADAITKFYAQNEDFIKQQYHTNLLKELTECDKQNLTLNLIGNLAFVHYHNPENNYVKECYETIISKLE